jgi:hypothetical protein
MDGVRLWLVFSQSRRPSNVLADEAASVEDARINDGDIIALEQKADGMWPAEREMSVSYNGNHGPVVPHGARADAPATRRMSVSYHMYEQ